MLKKVIIALTILLALVGIGVGVYLVQQQQRIDNEAAVPASEGGEVEIYLQPGDTTVDVGEELTLNVVLDTKQISITGITTALEYNFQGTNPFEVVSYDYQLVDSWSRAGFNEYKSDTLPHRFEFALTHNNGYASTQLAVYQIKLKAVAPGSATFKFNIADSTVYSKTDGASDILLIPSPEFNTYTVQAAAEGITPTAAVSPSAAPSSAVSPTTAPGTTVSPTTIPTQSVSPSAAPTTNVTSTPAAGGPEPTNTPVPTTTSNNNNNNNPTATPTSSQIAQANTPTSTRTPTPRAGGSTTEITGNTPTPAQLPVAANSTPTIVLGVVGALILIVGIALLL